MTRHIIMTLADDTTETECGSCRHVAVPDRILGTRICARPEFRDPNDALPVVWLSGRWVGRADACLAAEAAASRLVEIAPEDAALFTQGLRSGPDSASATKGAAGRRIRNALREHGRKR